MLTEAQKIDRCHKLMKHFNYQTTSSVDDLWSKLHKNGILVDDNKYYIWLHNQDRLGVEVFARALVICWSEEPRYWAYVKDETPSIYTKIDKVEVARLEDVCWLDVEAKFDTGVLTEGEEYEVFFDIEMLRGGKGWNCMMGFEQMGPLGEKKAMEMRVDQLMGAGRIEIPMGKFKVAAGSDTKGSFKMRQHGGQWKDGLIVRGVIIKPVVCCKCSLSGTPTNVRKLSDVSNNKIR